MRVRDVIKRQGARHTYTKLIICGCELLQAEVSVGKWRHAQFKNNGCSPPAQGNPGGQPQRRFVQSFGTADVDWKWLKPKAPDFAPLQDALTFQTFGWPGVPLEVSTPPVTESLPEAGP